MSSSNVESTIDHLSYLAKMLEVHYTFLMKNKKFEAAADFVQDAINNLNSAREELELL